MLSSAAVSPPIPCRLPLLLLLSLTACQKPAPVAADAGPAPVAATPARPAAPLLQEEAAQARFSNRDAQLTKDGLRLVFASTRDGLPQLYVTDAQAPDAPVLRLTHMRTRISAPLLLAHERTVLFRAETGQDGSTGLFEVGLDTGTVAPLTPGARLVRDPPLAPGGAPLRVLFSGRRVGEPTSTLYGLDLLPGAEPEPLFRDRGPGLLSDVAWDGERALWVHGTSLRSAAVSVVTAADGKARQLYPASGQAPVARARFANDDAHVLVATERPEGGVLLLLDAGSGRELARFTHAGGPVSDVLVAHEGGTAAVLVGAAGSEQLRLLDARTLKPRAPVRVPAGALALGRFSADGELLTLTWGPEGAEGRTNILGVEVRTGRVRALRQDGAPQPPG